jgi:hypothetical protein
MVRTPKIRIVMVISLLGTVSACTRKVVNFDGRSCDNAGGCNTGYVCRPTDKTCVPVFDCDNDCRTKIHPSSSCESVGQVLPCGDNTNNCEFGCRVCGSDVGGQWGVCLCGPGSKIGDPEACSTCNDDCTAKVQFAVGTCANSGSGYVCTHGACEAGHYDADGDPANGCEAVPEPEECDGKDNDFNGWIDDGNVCVPTDTPSEPSALLYQEPAGVDSQTYDTAFALYRVQGDGTTRLRLVVPSPNTTSVINFAISPDKRWVAYTRDGSSTLLYVATLVGEQAPQVVSQGLPIGGVVSKYVWAPNSSSIVYAASNGECAQCDGLYGAAPGNTGSPVRLDSLHGTASQRFPSIVWAPNSSFVAYTALLDGVSLDSYAAPMDGTASPSKLSTISSSGDYENLPMAWSFDSAHLAFWQGRSNDNSYDLIIGAPPSLSSSSWDTNLVNVTRSGIALQVAWQPAGSYLAIVGTDPETSKIPVLTYDVISSTTKIVSCAAGNRVKSVPLWSPNGTQLAYRADCNSSGAVLADLYVTPPTGVENVAPVYGVLATNTSVLDYKWSFDSTTLAYVVVPTPANGTGALYTVKVASGVTSKVCTNVCTPPLNGSTICNSFVSWSSLSSSVAYAGLSGTGMALFVASPGNSSVNVSGADIANILNFAWSPSEHHIAFLGTEDGSTWNLYTVTPDGRSKWRISSSTSSPGLISATYQWWQ